MKIFFFYLALIFNTILFGQDLNFKFCDAEIATNNDYSVKTTFSVDSTDISLNIDEIKNNLFLKSSIYFVKTNTLKNKIYIYHLASVSNEDLKNILSDSNLSKIDFNTTELVTFRYENNQIFNVNIEK